MRCRAKATLKKAGATKYNKPKAYMPKNKLRVNTQYHKLEATKWTYEALSNKELITLTAEF